MSYRVTQLAFHTNKQTNRHTYKPNRATYLPILSASNKPQWGWVRGHQTVTGCCDLDIGHREQSNIPFCSGRLALQLYEKTIWNYFIQGGGVKGHQILTSRCDLYIGHREKSNLPFCSGRLALRSCKKTIWKTPISEEIRGFSEMTFDLHTRFVTGPEVSAKTWLSRCVALSVSYISVFTRSLYDQ